MADNALNGQINCDAIWEYEQIRKFRLGTEQRSVCTYINMSNASVFHFSALASVGKTSLIRRYCMGLP